MNSKDVNDKDEKMRDKQGDMYRDIPPTGVCGLQNMGNTCFMNSALQCLASVPQLVEFFVSGEYHYQINKSNSRSKGILAQQFGQLIQSMWCGQSYRLHPSLLREEIIRLNPDFRGYYQHDSQELTTFLLDGLHEDLNRGKNISLKSPQMSDFDDSLNADEAWRIYKDKDDSIITDLMHGQFKSNLKCVGCGNSSDTFEPFCYLSLPLPQPKQYSMLNIQYYTYKNEEPTSLDECLLEFSSPEKIERECSNCHGKASTRTLNIWRLPKILIVLLKRYQFCRNDTRKIETPVEFMIRNFRLSDEAVANPEERNHTYDLIGVTMHSGTFSYGHYISYVLKNDAWYCIDDGHARTFDNPREKETTSDVYMLYYQQREQSISSDAADESARNGKNSDSGSGHASFYG